MKVTICIPAYNEVAIIDRTLETVHAFCRTQPEHEWSVVVANNGSTDGTGERARQVLGTHVLDVPTKGKGAAIVYAAARDTADIFCFIDADLSAHPDALPKLIAQLDTGADIAIGSRLLDLSTTERSFFRSLSSYIFNICRRVILGLKVSDSQCGLKALNTKGRSLLASCKETGWFFDMELLTKAERAGLHVAEVAVPWQETVYAGRESKLRLLRDGWQSILAMVRIRRREFPSNPTPRLFHLRILITAAVLIYGGFFAWYAHVVQETEIPRATLFFERGDATGYVEMADSIIRGDDSLVPDNELTRGLRTPGYPLFLSGILSFTREPFVIIAIQILVALLTVPLIYSLCHRLTNASIAFWTTLAYILYPTTAFLNTQILSETVFMFCTTLSLWLLLAAPTHWSWRYAAVGATAGAAILIRPSFLYVLPLIIALVVVRERKIWQSVNAGIVILATTFLLLAPWLHANQRDFGQASLSTAGTFNLLYVYIPQFLAHDKDATSGWLAIHQEFIDQTREAGYEIGSHRASVYERERIQAELSGNTLPYAFFHIKRSVLTFLSSGFKMVNNEFAELNHPLFSATPWLIQHIYTHGISWDVLKNNSLALSDAAFGVLVMLLMPLTVIAAFLRKNAERWSLLFILSMILITAMLAGPNGNARYRMPLQPYIFLLAFAAIAIIYNRIKKHS